MQSAEVQAAQSPEAWPKYKGKTRRIVDHQFKFSLVYVHGRDDLYVVAVAPMRRKPGYWKARVMDRLGMRFRGQERWYGKSLATHVLGRAEWQGNQREQGDA